MSPPAPEPRLTPLRSICGALTASLGLYLGIAWFYFTGADAEARLGDAPALLPEALALLGVVIIVAAPLSRSLVWRRVSGPRRRDPTVQLNSFITGTVVSFALREAGAVFGFVVTVLTADVVWVASLSALALVAMLLDWPTDFRWERYRTALE